MTSRLDENERRQVSRHFRPRMRQLSPAVRRPLCGPMTASYLRQRIFAEENDVGWEPMSQNPVATMWTGSKICLGLEARNVVDRKRDSDRLYKTYLWAGPRQWLNRQIWSSELSAVPYSVFGLRQRPWPSLQC